MNPFGPRQDIYKVLESINFTAFTVVANGPFLRNEIFFILLWRVMTATFALFLGKGHVENGTNYCREDIIEFGWKSRNGR
jgi:hypothetical protein